MRPLSLIVFLFTTSFLTAQGVQVNGDFEEGESTGWTEWQSPWGEGFSYDYASSLNPFEGDSCLYMSASNGSFGVYQEFCVEPDAPFNVSWAWWGSSTGNGWWEVLIIDAPYSYEAADDPVNHPETLVASKWEQGFAGAFPEPSEEWTEAELDEAVLPTSEVVTVVLKCGSSQGGFLEVGFDEVVVEHESDLLELTSVEPQTGSVSGGETIVVSGRNLTPDSVIALGEKELIDQVRLSTCKIRGTAPEGEAGTVDVTVTTSGGTAKLTDGYTYEAEGPFFARGDCNSDGKLDIADGITLLGYLFNQEAEPPCLEACNSNDDADLDISDVIAVLNHLFAQAGPLPEPHPECGVDPTPSLSCEQSQPACEQPAK